MGCDVATPSELGDMEEEMKESVLTTEITRMSIDLEFSKGNPPEDALRMALAGLFTSLAMAVKNSDSPEYWFPMAFPMEMSLKSEQLRWDFRLVAKFTNVFDKGDGQS